MAFASMISNCSGHDTTLLYPFFSGRLYFFADIPFVFDILLSNFFGIERPYWLVGNLKPGWSLLMST